MLQDDEPLPVHGQRYRWGRIITTHGITHRIIRHGAVMCNSFGPRKYCVIKGVVEYRRSVNCAANGDATPRPADAVEAGRRQVVRKREACLA